MTLELLGAPGSPYTRKMLALLRYRRIPYAVRWGSHRQPSPGLPDPKVKLLPTVYFPTADGLEAVTDSTPILRRLEAEHDGRSALPADPALAFLDALIEDYADEWLTKPMFHFRWAHEAAARNAGPLLAFWQDTTLSDAEGERISSELTRRQIDRLHVVGSNPETAETIERSFERLVDLLDRRLSVQGFVLGARPAASDFAIFGQLTQLGVVEPTSAAILGARSGRLRAWIDRVEDLSGLAPAPEGWLSDLSALRPLLSEIGRTYAPFLLANAAAVTEGAAEVRAEIDGRPWVQPPFPYQAKCLATLREAHRSLPPASRAAADAAMDGTGCETLFR